MTPWRALVMAGWWGICCTVHCAESPCSIHLRKFYSRLTVEYRHPGLQSSFRTTIEIPSHPLAAFVGSWQCTVRHGCFPVGKIEISPSRQTVLAVSLLTPSKAVAYHDRDLFFSSAYEATIPFEMPLAFEWSQYNAIIPPVLEALASVSDRYLEIRHTPHRAFAVLESLHAFIDRQLPLSAANETSFTWNRASQADLCCSGTSAPSQPCESAMGEVVRWLTGQAESLHVRTQFWRGLQVEQVNTDSGNQLRMLESWVVEAHDTHHGLTRAMVLVAPRKTALR